MMPLMRMPSEIIASELAQAGEVRKVLDIAAGHGIFGIAIARKNPQAQIYAVDWPKVLDVARENANKRVSPLAITSFREAHSMYSLAVTTIWC